MLFLNGNRLLETGLLYCKHLQEYEILEQFLFHGHLLSIQHVYLADMSCILSVLYSLTFPLCTSSYSIMQLLLVSKLYTIFLCMQSVTVRWEAPPKEGRNGIITGYKLRYRKRDRRGERRGDTVTTAGDRRLYTLVGLERRSVYQVRLWALNVNGTGPPTEWYTIETYENDLDESQVPDMPSALKGTDKMQYVQKGM